MYKLSTLTDTMVRAAQTAVIKKAKPQLSAIYIQVGVKQLTLFKMMVTCKMSIIEKKLCGQVDG